MIGSLVSTDPESAIRLAVCALLVPAAWFGVKGLQRVTWRRVKTWIRPEWDRRDANRTALKAIGKAVKR